MLISPQGQLLAGDQADQDKTDGFVRSGDLLAILNGQTVTHVEYNAENRTDVIDIYVPAFDVNQQLVGIVRMTSSTAGCLRRFRLGWLAAAGDAGA